MYEACLIVYLVPSDSGKTDEFYYVGGYCLQFSLVGQIVCYFGDQFFHHAPASPLSVPKVITGLQLTVDMVSGQLRLFLLIDDFVSFSLGKSGVNVLDGLKPDFPCLFGEIEIELNGLMIDGLDIINNTKVLFK